VSCIPHNSLLQALTCGRCGEEIRSLQRFVDAQRMAFRKILKKYKVRRGISFLPYIHPYRTLTSTYQKWTGSRTLGDRFEQEVLNNPKSFTRRDFEPLLREYNNILAHLRASTPDASEPTSPIPRSRSRSRSPRPRAQRPAPQLERQSYWNEYDDGSEAENEPYTIYVNPGTESTFSGPSRLASLFSRVTAPMEQVRAWLNPSSSGGERRPLLGTSSSFTEQTETDVDDASSSDFPSGYAAHYATFPSINDQKFSRSRERLLFHSTIASFAAALVLVLVAGLLVATGRHKLRVEVDAGAIVGVVSSLFFATLGFGTMLYRTERLSWLHRICVICTFVGLCVLNGLLLVIVVGNTGL